MRGRWLKQIGNRALESRRVVVVRAVHKHTWHVERWAESAKGWLDCIGVAKVVAGVDNQVWLQRAKGLDKRLLASLPRCHVNVADVQNTDGLGASRQNCSLGFDNGEAPAGEGHGIDADREGDGKRNG